MKKNRKVMSFLIALMLTMVCMLPTASSAQAAGAGTDIASLDVKTGTYTPWAKYAAKRAELDRMCSPNARSRYIIMDIDRNGVAEMIYGTIAGQLLKTRVYTYKNKKVILARDWDSGIEVYSRPAGKPYYVCTTGRVELGHYIYTVYKMNSTKTKLTKIATYDVNDMSKVFYHNGKKCSAATAHTFVKGLKDISWRLAS